MRVLRVFLTMALTAAALPLFAQAINMRPGNYEATMEMEMPGSQKMPPMKTTQCITAADLKDISKKMLDPGTTEGCKVADYKLVGNRLTFNATCKAGDVSYTTAADMTFSAESYTGVVTSKDSKGQGMTMKMSGKRIGDCKD